MMDGITTGKYEAIEKAKLYALAWPRSGAARVPSPEYVVC
jgi:hypothetical protein